MTTRPTPAARRAGPASREPRPPSGPGPAVEVRAAFTLVEVMVVVGILGLVLAMGMPPFIRSLKKDSLRQASSDIEEGCSKARALAILRGVPAELILRSGGQLSVAEAPRPRDLWADPGGAPGPAAGDNGGPPAPTFNARLQEDVGVTLLYVNLKDQMQSQETHVRFYPNGTSDEFTIVLQTARGVRKLSLECVTGLPRLEVLR